ncbi:hypothetical protein TcasGA2_TC010675 [Tribolium castaneum]|nr:truncated knickkopf 3 [Tribolium castaneum]KYB25165.1 hypothetical protein TcasGA2_TC010675 [Tribolium castaneum]
MGPIVAFAVIIAVSGGVSGAPYLGKFIGKLSELHHGVSGEVYAVDGRTLYLKDFTYDGQGPAAYFYASTSRNANSAGFRLRDENGSPEVIRRYRKEGVTLTLPEGKTLNNIKIFYVWCEEFEVNFGDVKIPRGFDYPKPQKIEPLKGVHAISSDPIVIVDAQTLLVPNLSYDGEAPDAKFWVGRGPKPSPQGIRVPDENGKMEPLRRYDRKTVVLTLPGDLTVFDIGHFGIWCEAFTVDFGHVQIPQNVNVPPSLKMLGVSPQKRPRNFDISREVSRPRVPLVGGQLEATTFRPRQFQNFIQRPQPSQNFGPFVQQQQLLTPQQIYAQQRIDQNVYQQPQFRQPVPYTPFNLQQRQYQEQLAYNQFLQNKRLLEEQQIKAQLNRQHNRFDLAAGGQNGYVPFG